MSDLPRECVDCRIEVAKGVEYCPDCGRFISKVQARSVSPSDGTAAAGAPSLRRSLIIAGVIFVFDAFLFNQGLVAVVAGSIAVLIFAGKLVASIFTKVEPFASRAARLAIYVVMAVCVVGANTANNKIARGRADQLISACAEYKAKHDKFPDRLEDLVPEFMPKIPRAKYTLMYQDFSYFNVEEKHHSLFWYSFPPFGRPIYSLEEETWGYLD